MLLTKTGAAHFTTRLSLSCLGLGLILLILFLVLVHVLLLSWSRSCPSCLVLSLSLSFWKAGLVLSCLVVSCLVLSCLLSYVESGFASFPHPLHSVLTMTSNSSVYYWPSHVWILSCALQNKTRGFTWQRSIRPWRSVTFSFPSSIRNTAAHNVRHEETSSLLVGLVLHRPYRCSRFCLKNPGPIHYGWLRISMARLACTFVQAVGTWNVWIWCIVSWNVWIWCSPAPVFWYCKGTNQPWRQRKPSWRSTAKCCSLRTSGIGALTMLQMVQ